MKLMKIMKTIDEIKEVINICDVNERITVLKQLGYKIQKHWVKGIVGTVIIKKRKKQVLIQVSDSKYIKQHCYLADVVVLPLDIKNQPN